MKEGSCGIADQYHNTMNGSGGEESPGSREMPEVVATFARCQKSQKGKKSGVGSFEEE